MPRRPWIRDVKVAQYGGYVLVTLGALCLYDAFENRGRKRPFGTKLLPGG